MAIRCKDVQKNTLERVFVFVLFVVELGFQLRVSLVKWVLCCLSHTSSPFCSGYEDGALDTSFLL
jgi:hypothetical protein